MLYIAVTESPHFTEPTILVWLPFCSGVTFSFVNFSIYKKEGEAAAPSAVTPGHVPALKFSEVKGLTAQFRSRQDRLETHDAKS